MQQHSSRRRGKWILAIARNVAWAGFQFTPPPRCEQVREVDFRRRRSGQVGASRVLRTRCRSRRHLSIPLLVREGRIRLPSVSSQRPRHHRAPARSAGFERDHAVVFLQPQRVIIAHGTRRRSSAKASRCLRRGGSSPRGIAIINAEQFERGIRIEFPRARRSVARTARAARPSAATGVEINVRFLGDGRRVFKPFNRSLMPPRTVAGVAPFGNGCVGFAELIPRDVRLDGIQNAQSAAQPFDDVLREVLAEHAAVFREQRCSAGLGGGWNERERSLIFGGLEFHQTHY